MIKRLLDIAASLTGLIVLSPLLAGVVALVRLDSPGPAFFRQARVGRGFKTFFILKFRTMTVDASEKGGPITFGSEPRITRAGRVLRKFKIDELPQLWNVLLGEMSLVGPRPEVPSYVELFRSDYEMVLSVRPGITDIASIRFRDEAALLGRSADPAREYREHVLPQKIALAKEYIRRRSFAFDLVLIGKTVLGLSA